MIPERFSRSARLLGADAMEKLFNSTVAIFGIGGVGSYAAEALARAGVGHLVLIDNDDIAESNINRQIHALSSTVGRMKTEVMAERIRNINPAAVVDCINEFYLPEVADRFFICHYDYMVDAVDTVTAKIDLVLQAQKRGIPIISSMGAGNKLNPAELEVADIYKTSVCPLARAMRAKLKKLGIKHLKVVYSKEQPLRPMDDGEPKSAMEGFAGATGRDAKRRSVPGSVSFVPSVAGIIAASEVIKDLISNRK